MSTKNRTQLFWDASSALQIRSSPAFILQGSEATKKACFTEGVSVEANSRSLADSVGPRLFFWMFGAGKMAQQGVTHTIPRKDKGPLRGIHFYGVFVLHATSCTAFFVFFGGKSTFGYLKGIHGWIC